MGAIWGPKKTCAGKRAKGVNMCFFRVVQFHMMITTEQKVWNSFGPDFTFRGEINRQKFHRP